jgi:DNA-binding MarR family transcriptional regulator
MGVVQVKRAADRRAKEVRLSARGWQGVQYARETRARLENELAHRLGERRYSQTKEALQACLDLVGGVEAIQSRRVRQPE